MLSRTKFVVHVVDDDDSLRTALARVIGLAGFGVRTYPSAGAYLVAEHDEAPSCLLLDLEMPDADGLALQQALLRNGSATPIIFMSAYADIPRTVRAIKAGAVEFLTKPIETDVLLQALDSVLLVAGHEIKAAPSVPLNDREEAVLRGVLAGSLNKAIAAQLHLSERTIKTCRATLMRKLGAQSLAELIQRGELLVKG